MTILARSTCFTNNCYMGNQTLVLSHQVLLAACMEAMYRISVTEYRGDVSPRGKHRTASLGLIPLRLTGHGYGLCTDGRTFSMRCGNI